MRYCIAALLLVSFACTSYGQRAVQEKLYSRSLKDTVYYDVFFPEDWEGWDESQPHPVLYTFTYGMMNGEYLAAQMSYFRKAHYSMPNTIIVNIQTDMNRIGFSYTTGLLTTTGLNFVRCIKNELIPLVERNYHASPFRTYIGHSYAASYANYLFQYEPGMFSAYILLAPEKTGPDNPPFSVDQKTKAFYDKKTTFYYIAVGEFDLPGRHAYAREIEEKTQCLDSTKFIFKYDSIARGDHNNILTVSIQFALEHIYQFYSPYGENDTLLTVVQQLESVANRVKNVYGLPLEKRFTYYNYFAQLAVQNKDTAGLVKVLEYFYTNRLKGWNIMQFGTFCKSLGLLQKAKYYFELAITKIEKEEMQSEVGPSNLMDCYHYMAFDIIKNDPAKGWACLQKCIPLSKIPNKSGSKNVEVYYYLGKFAAENNYKVKEGLQYLLQYRKLTTDDTAHTMLNFQLGRCYYLLKDTVNARQYLQEALKLNANNTLAKELLQKMK